MITIYCGDNTVQSRNQFAVHRQRDKQNGIECIEIPSSSISEIQSIIHGTASLFSPRRSFFIENVVSKKGNRDELEAFVVDPDINIVIWEEKTDDRTIKRYFSKSKVLVSKLPATIWKLLDAVYPGNAAQVIKLMDQVVQTVDENMVLYMMQRRIKDMILVRKKLSGKNKLASWQQKNLLSQSNRWSDPAELHRMYTKLYDVETGIKTGTLPYSIKEALDILFSFYLQ